MRAEEVAMYISAWKKKNSYSFNYDYSAASNVLWRKTGSASKPAVQLYFGSLRSRKPSSKGRYVVLTNRTSAEGSAGSESISNIVDDLHQMGQEKSWAQEMKKSIQDGKRYFKTG